MTSQLLLKVLFNVLHISLSDFHGQKYCIKFIPLPVYVFLEYVYYTNFVQKIREHKAFQITSHLLLKFPTITVLF